VIFPNGVLAIRENHATFLLFTRPPPFPPAKRVVIFVMDSYYGETALGVSVFGTVLQRR